MAAVAVVMNDRQWELQELGPSKLDHKQHAGRQRSSLGRAATITGAIAGCLVAIILLLRFLAVPLLVYLAPRLDLTFYDWGLYGAYPTQWYQSIDLAAPCARTVQWNDTCSDGLVMLSLSGPGIDYAGPMILDHQGELVWTTQDFGAAGNLKVQQYDGEDYLTFWAGEKLQESGQGKYYMVGSSVSSCRFETLMFSSSTPLTTSFTLCPRLETAFMGICMSSRSPMMQLRSSPSTTKPI